MITEALTSSRYSKILRMLDEERQLLLSGPLDKLQALVSSREAAMNELLSSGASLPEAFIVALKARAERNGRVAARQHRRHEIRTRPDRGDQQADRRAAHVYRRRTQVRVSHTQGTRDTRA